ncbi:MAG: polyamine aminopropyltransferase [Acidobacteriota bacterium]
MHTRPAPSLLFLNIFVVAACGLIYELLAGTLASFVLGDSVTQFSLIIGIYLTALGAGAWLSGYMQRSLARTFLEIELAVALLGGLSAPILFLGFSRLSWFRLLLYLIVFGIGVLVGLELPLLMRILKDRVQFKDLVSRAMAFDYVGALVASLAFPLFLVPHLGLVRTSLMFGMINALVALWGTWLLASEFTLAPRGLRWRAILVLLLLGAGVWQADRLTTFAEDGLYDGEIVYSKTSSYQRIVITRSRSGFELYLNGNLQFHSADEYRYHEALVHPALAASAAQRSVLILGGGDGLALREVLRWPQVEAVTLVDLDPAMTTLSQHFPPLAALNQQAFQDRRVQVINRDALIWLQQDRHRFDAAIVDFPDPNSFALGKLYTRHFYRLLAGHLEEGAAISVQSGSPLFARQAFWCVVRTLEAAGFHVQPYHAAVPSFGEWGFALAKLTAFQPPQQTLAGLRFLDQGSLASMFRFAPDMQPVEVEINRLDNQALVRLTEDEWRRWER